MPRGIFQCAVWLCAALAGCAGRTEERLAVLEAGMEDARLQGTRIALLEERVNFLSPSVLAGEIQEKQNSSGKQAAKGASGARSPVAKESTSSVPAPAAGEAAAYGQALAVFEQRHYANALPLFAAFLRQYPGGKLAANAAYWSGECHYGLKQYDRAILVFKDVANKYSQHPKAAAALLKLGFAYDRLGDVENARFYLQTLLQEYPASEPAALARKKLASL